jgi:hypothetical protein
MPVSARLPSRATRRRLGRVGQDMGAKMKPYDPLVAPDPVEWLALDENERNQLVMDYHRRARVRLPNDRLHSAFHVIVENQFALGDELPVRRTVERLTNEGLDRHEAVHAVASVFTDHLHDVMRNAGSEPFSQDAYNADVERLTVESWRRKYRSDNDGESSP